MRVWWACTVGAVMVMLLPGSGAVIAEPAGVARTEAAAASEVSVPSAPRPAQIEPMVAPVKREAPPVPVIKPAIKTKADEKAAGKSAAAKKPDDKKPLEKSSSKTAEKTAAQKK